MITALTLPYAVARYFRFALAPDQRRIASATFIQSGTLRANAQARWLRFTATEQISTQPVALCWDARASIAPLLNVHIRDSYSGGTGESRAQIADLIAIPGPRSCRETTSASLVRFLAEAAWYPTVLLPHAGVCWTAVDDRHASVALTDHGVTVSIDVTFGHFGEILEVTTMRYRTVGRAMILTPWSGRYFEYFRKNGMMIPLAAEVAWHLPDGFTPVWRGTLRRCEYIFNDD